MWIASKKEEKNSFCMREFREIFMNLVHSTLPASVSRRVFRLYSFCLHFMAFFSLSIFFFTPLLCDCDAVCASRMALLCERLCVSVCIWKLCRIHTAFIWFNSIHLFALTILRSSCAFLRRLSCKLDHLLLPLSANIYFFQLVYLFVC